MNVMLAHHAYYVEGSLDALPALEELVAKREEGNVFACSYGRFGIADAHELVRRASLKSDARQILVIAAASLTSEAQQALLKSFEEPRAGVVFVLLAPKGILLPTLLSRCLPFPEKITPAREAPRAPREFLSASGKERSAQIMILLKDEERAHENARALISGAEQVLYEKLESAKERRKILAGLEEIAAMRLYINDRSASLKMLLEHLAAALPKI